MPSVEVPAAQPKWGDEDNEDMFPPEGVIDENGIKTTVEFRENEKGQRVKVVRRVRVVKKVVRKNKRAEERRKWKKFGECAGLPAGPEAGITAIGDEISLVLGVAEKQEKKPADMSVSLGIQCRICGKAGEHWTSKCPYRTESSGDVPPDEDAPAAEAGGPGKYVPPSRRAGAKPGEGPMGMGSRDEPCTVRVTNLSEDTKESDLQELFRPFGPVSRVYLAKDRENNLSRGFAFVNFIHQADAARAIEKLNGFGYDHLILHLEWAKPSGPK
eukprot:TRINITY_DN1805_c0_g1_i2.p1 TRINITY_DN1805_c0_g1~~TRINITY_DN1805_c0_g1_i2.p1  ORF type:complete len:271 (-),score=63.35 TRINITY_DN1805_c0_g1_i2:47-859(-)